MAGLVGYKGTLTIYNIAIAELTDLDLSATREDHDASDLADYYVQHTGGRANFILTGNANYLTRNSSLLRRLRTSVSANINATGVFRIKDPKGSTAYSGAGAWLDAGMTMPAGPMVMPFRAALNTFFVSPSNVW